MNKSFLKWAGGKYKLLPIINHNIDTSYDFVDVFAGAGSVWLNSTAPLIIANDLNNDLMNCFRQIRDNLERLIASVFLLFYTDHKGHSKESYTALRNEFNTTDDLIRKGALFIYLNKHCFNGLCRYNKKGGFNVPFGNKTTELKPPIAEIEHAYHKMHKNDLIDNSNVVIECLGYAECIAQYDSPKTMFYLDPPYIPVKKDSFVAYCGPFPQADHEALAALCKDIKGRFLMSNSDTEMTRELYKDFYMAPLEVSRTIHAKGANNVAKELLISNMPIKGA